MGIQKLLRSKYLFYILFFLAAVAWRGWYGLSHLNFQQDTARDIYLINEWRDSGEILLAYGPKTSIGNFFLPPLYYQIQLLFAYIFPKYIFIMNFVTILIEAFTPIILYLILKELVGEKISVLVSAAYIIFALPLVFGSFAWNPNMIPFFSTLSLYCYMRAYSRKEFWLVIPASVCVAIAFNLHYQAFVLFPFSLMFFVYSLRYGWHVAKYWLMAAMIILAIFSGYIWGEVNAGFSNTQHILHYFGSEHAQIYDRVSKPAFIFVFLPDFLERVVTGNDRYYFNISLGRILFFVGFFIWLYKAWKLKSGNSLHAFIFIYFISIIIALRLYKGDKLDYYLETLYILPVFLFAYLIQLNKAFIALLILSILLIPAYIKGNKPYNQFAELSATMSIISKNLPDNSARVYFYNEDDINIFAFGIRKLSNISISQRDSDILEICRRNDTCIYNGLPQCNYSRIYSRLALLKWENGYTLEDVSYTQNYQILIGKLHKTESSYTDIYSYNTKVGSDKLLPELYE